MKKRNKKWDCGMTHHMACACREEKSQAISKAARRLLDAMPITEKLYLEKYVEALEKCLCAMEA